MVAHYCKWTYVFNWGVVNNRAQANFPFAEIKAQLQQFDGNIESC